MGFLVDEADSAGEFRTSFGAGLTELVSRTGREEDHERGIKLKLANDWRDLLPAERGDVIIRESEDAGWDCDGDEVVGAKLAEYSCRRSTLFMSICEANAGCSLTVISE